ncbi:MAG: ATP-binding cassette domain-containing protein, partial [Chloroflexota bacterium]|nr:ATP-binding cassette domain-containing protein [Chloroflexota bacterium]
MSKQIFSPTTAVQSSNLQFPDFKSPVSNLNSLYPYKLMPAIEVTNLEKTFQTKRKAAGMGGSVRALFKPEYSSIEAVHRLTFQMDSGELLGFIGPNGAGKSTTIKMLTGILHPTGGDAKVLGYT